MNGNNGELTIFFLGIAASLSTFHHYFAAEGAKRKSWLFISLLVLSIGTQLATQGLQFRNAVITRREEDRRISDALYAFNQSNERLLLKVADPRLSDINAYILGYWYFKKGAAYSGQGDTEAAKTYRDHAKSYLNLAIQTKRFIPQSYYLLATVNRTTQSDWTEAREDFEKAIKEDNEYPAAFYGRAILRQESSDLQGPLDDLEQATRYGVIPCWDMRDPDEQATVWKKVYGLNRYHEIADECGARFGLLPPAQAGPEEKKPQSSGGPAKK